MTLAPSTGFCPLVTTPAILPVVTLCPNASPPANAQRHTTAATLLIILMARIIRVRLDGGVKMLAMAGMRVEHVNAQLPTPNSQGSMRWELEVGSWKLTPLKRK